MNEYGEGPGYGIQDRQRQKAKRRCPCCQGELYSGDRVYDLPEGEVCAPCFEDWARELLAAAPETLARRLGVEAGWA